MTPVSTPPPPPPVSFFTPGLDSVHLKPRWDSPNPSRPYRKAGGGGIMNSLSFNKYKHSNRLGESLLTSLFTFFLISIQLNLKKPWPYIRNKELRNRSFLGYFPMVSLTIGCQKFLHLVLTSSMIPFVYRCIHSFLLGTWFT